MQTPPRRSHPARAILVGIVAIGILLGAFGLAWSSSPDARGIILLGGFVVDVAVVCGGYLLQRRLHW